MSGSCDKQHSSRRSRCHRNVNIRLDVRACIKQSINIDIWKTFSAGSACLEAAAPAYARGIKRLVWRLMFW